MVDSVALSFSDDPRGAIVRWHDLTMTRIPARNSVGFTEDSSESSGEKQWLDFDGRVDDISIRG